VAPGPKGTLVIKKSHHPHQRYPPKVRGARTCAFIVCTARASYMQNQRHIFLQCNFSRHPCRSGERPGSGLRSTTNKGSSCSIVYYCLSGPIRRRSPAFSSQLSHPWACLTPKKRLHYCRQNRGQVNRASMSQLPLFAVAWHAEEHPPRFAALGSEPLRSTDPKMDAEGANARGACLLATWSGLITSCYILSSH